MTPGKPEVPLVLHIKRNGPILKGAVQSRSDPSRTLHPSIRLQAVLLCGCNGNLLRDSRCAHLKAILNEMSREELVEFILTAQHIPPPISKEEE